MFCKKIFSPKFRSKQCYLRYVTVTIGQHKEQHIHYSRGIQWPFQVAPPISLMKIEKGVATLKLNFQNPLTGTV